MQFPHFLGSKNERKARGSKNYIGLKHDQPGCERTENNGQLKHGHGAGNKKNYIGKKKYR